jgi:CheY-like chemotaxis protein
MKRLRQIILVDDDPINNFVVDHLLKKMDVANEIHIFQSCTEALDYVSQNCTGENGCPELVLADINMSEMDGFEFVRRFKNLDLLDKGKVMFAMISNSNHPKDVSSMEELNVEYLLNKPITKEMILDIIDKCLKKDSLSL